MTTLWDPIEIGGMKLPHRLALAPMTRSRALPDGTLTPLTAEYYAQRASLGLLITEGTQPSADGQGYMATPGIYTPEHEASWRQVADAVHAKGGKLFIQVMHAGRVGHPDNTPHHRQLVAPSAVAPGGQVFTPTGLKDTPVPRALSAEEIRATVDDFRRAAASAIRAGADGVEIHGANGYLVNQFLAPNANLRTDAHGGSIDNRIRFAVEVAAAIAGEIGPERTGIRLSPGGPVNGIDDGPEGPELYRRLVARLTELDLAYLHLFHFGSDALLAELRALWPNALLLVRPGRTREQIGRDVAAGLADVEPVGTFALANPDLVERLKSDAELNTADRATFFGGGAAGYTDYPRLEVAAPVA